MKLIVNIDGRPLETEIIRSENGVEAIVDGRKYDLESSTPEPNVWLLKLDTEVVEFTVVAKDGGGYELVTSDASFSVSVSDPRKLGSSTDGAAGADGLVEIRTQMPGKVVRVLVSSGDPVSKGDGLVVVEAMKMQNEMKSPKDGTVREITFSEGDTVNAGDLLIVVE